jgi:hypothetical protein
MIFISDPQKLYYGTPVHMPHELYSALHGYRERGGFISRKRWVGLVCQRGSGFLNAGAGYLPRLYENIWWLRMVV